VAAQVVTAGEVGPALVFGQGEEQLEEVRHPLWRHPEHGLEPDPAQSVHGPRGRRPEHLAGRVERLIRTVGQPGGHGAGHRGCQPERGRQAEPAGRVHQRGRRAEAQSRARAVPGRVQPEQHPLVGGAGHPDAVPGQPGGQPAAQHRHRQARPPGQRGLLEQYRATAQRNRVQERGWARLAVIGPPVHEQRLAGGEQPGRRIRVDEHPVGRLLGRNPTAGRAERLPAATGVHHDPGPHLAAAGQGHRARPGPPDHPPGPDRDFRRGHPGIEVGPQRRHVQHGVRPAELVLAARDRSTEGARGDHRRGQPGRQLVDPAAVGVPPGGVRRLVQQHRAQPEPAGLRGERATGRAAADHEHVRDHLPVLPGTGG
jgi:hypothetical protein